MKYSHNNWTKNRGRPIYTFGVTKADEKTYVKCRAEYVGETQIVKERREESKEELKNKEAKFLAHDRAVNFTSKHQDWLYEIPEWKAKNLTKKLAELLEEEKKENKEEKEVDISSSTSNSKKTKSEPPK